VEVDFHPRKNGRYVTAVVGGRRITHIFQIPLSIDRGQKPMPPSYACSGTDAATLFWTCIKIAKALKE
jgi:hypothetical protein